MSDVIDRSLVRPDGRRVAWSETAVLDGRPVIRLPGTPGSRLSLRADRTVWTDRGLRMITVERPGYGISTRLPGRGFVGAADDLVAVLDELAIGAAPVIGGSGGGPHVLAWCATHPERVTAASIVVGAAPLNADEESQLIPLNRQAVGMARAHDWEGMRRLLEPERERMLLDPIAGFRAVMATAPQADQEIMSDPAWQEGFARGLREALRPGIEGWVDEAILIGPEWTDFDPRAITTSVVWWHGDGDRNAPLTAARRAVSSIPAIELRVWENAGHLTAYKNEGHVLDDLMHRADASEAGPFASSRGASSP